MALQRNCYTTINDAYLDFMVEESRYQIIYGGRGSSKSVSTAQKIIYRCISEIGTPDEPFSHIFTVIRKYKTTIVGSVFKRIKEELIRMGIDQMVTMNESYHVFKFWNGSEIRCIGVDDPEKVKSLETSGIWVEEATELDEEDFQMLDLCIRGDSPYSKQIILTFNPIDESHWIKRVFFDTPQSGLTYILHTTYLDNHFIDEQYKKILVERYSFDPNLYRINILGQWGRVKTGSEFYFNFKYDRHTKKVNWANQLPLHISFDFNVNPYITAIVAQIVKREIPDEKGGEKSFFFLNVIDEFALPNPLNTTERLCDEIKLKYEHELKWGLYIYGDASGRTKSTHSNITDYDIIDAILGKYMNNYGSRVPKANPMIRQRRYFIAKAMYGGFNIEINVDRKCKKLIADFESCIESADGSIHKQTARGKDGVLFEKYGHHADAFSYLICEAFKNQFENFM